MRYTRGITPSVSIRNGTMSAVRFAAFMLVVVLPVKAALPSLSVSLVDPDYVQVSWPSNYTSANWRLVYSTNLASASWQPVLQIPVPSVDGLVTTLLLTDL